LIFVGFTLHNFFDSHEKNLVYRRSSYCIIHTIQFITSNLLRAMYLIIQFICMIISLLEFFLYYNWNNYNGNKVHIEIYIQN